MGVLHSRGGPRHGTCLGIGGGGTMNNIGRLQQRIEDARRLTHIATQRATRNSRDDPGVRRVRDGVIIRVRRRWAAFSLWKWK